MKFGSVEFFKVLIKTVLAIVFFVPLLLCIVFAVLLFNTNAELDSIKRENEVLSYRNAMLGGGNAATVEEFYKLYQYSGLDDRKLAEYLAARGVTADKPVTSSAEKTEPAAPAASAEDSTPTVPTVEAQSAEPVQAQPESPYAAIHTDMQVSCPADFVREEGTVYLTFDDGPSANTYSVLHYLEKHNVKATFFVVPSRTDECFELLRKITQAGHSIGVHSASHDYKKIYASTEAFLEDFYEAWSIIYEATGVKTEIFRFPGGSVNDFDENVRDDIIAEMSRRGFRYFDWNVDSNDAGGATWTEMYNSIPSDIAGNYRSVVLMHDSAARENTVYVLDDVLRVLVAEGYKLDCIHNDTKPVQFVGPFA
ncbi:MAG: polysaccharide deacetylase family protein [Oscillospiraceae bacterium]